MRHASLVALLLTALVLAEAHAETFVVDWSGIADFETIQDGLDAASGGDTVLIAGGTYSGDRNTELDFHGDGILLRPLSGFRYETIIEGGSHRAFLFDDGEDSLAVVDGLRITHCIADTGGAVLIRNSSPTFRNCSIEYGFAVYAGGGVFARGGDPTFDSCTFYRDSADDGGGVVILNGAATFRNCTFSTNHAGYEGGGARILGSQVVFEDCYFGLNDALTGGALSLRRPATVDVSGCDFIRNTSRSYGAAIHMYGCSAAISECYFEKNAPTGGGTVWGEYSSPVMSHCTFWDNRGSYEPDTAHDLELYHTDIGDALIEDCTFCGWRMNTRDDGALLRFGDCKPLIERSIIAFHNYGPAVSCTGTGEPTIRECVVYGNVGGDEICGDDPNNNMSVDPLFCGFWSGDMTLCANSPCLPQYNPWGIVVGAHDTGCDNCDTPVERTSWGTIKAMFR